MRRWRFPLALTLTTALLGVALPARAADPPVPTDDPTHAERSLLRHLHFEYGLVVACGLADDEADAGYRIRTSKLEQRLGIDSDPDAQFRELNLGWTEADANWAAANGPSFRDWCRSEAAAARDRFHQAFRDTGEKLNLRAKSRTERRP